MKHSRVEPWGGPTFSVWKNEKDLDSEVEGTPGESGHQEKKLFPGGKGD